MELLLTGDAATPQRPASSRQTRLDDTEDGAAFQKQAVEYQGTATAELLSGAE
jgi:hypothetical protein